MGPEPRSMSLFRTCEKMPPRFSSCFTWCLGSKPNKSKVLSVESDNDSLSPSVYGEGEDDEKQLVLAQ